MISPPPELLDQVSRFTILTPARLAALYGAAHQVITEGVQGSFVECGSMNGGSGALLAKAAAEYGPRDIWLFDSFEGLPTAGPEDLKTLGQDGRSADMLTGSCKGTVKAVLEAMNEVGADLARVHIVPGWFEATLPPTVTGHIALLHLDADFYDSTWTALNTLYPRISPGGMVVVDDYGAWPGCRAAVNAFFAAHPPVPELGFTYELTGEFTAVLFRKPDFTAKL